MERTFWEVAGCAGALGMLLGAALGRRRGGIVLAACAGVAVLGAVIVGFGNMLGLFILYSVGMPYVLIAAQSVVVGWLAGAGLQSLRRKLAVKRQRAADVSRP